MTQKSFDSHISDFEKGIENSLSDYKSFTNDLKWKTFKTHLLSVAATHNVSDVFELSYVSSSVVFRVLTECLQTGKSKKILREHKATLDAQAVYQALLDLYEGDTAAQLEEKCLEHI